MEMPDFEPGSVVCENCHCRNDDPWNDHPDGFKWFSQWKMWLCDECEDDVVEAIEYGPRNQ